LTEVYLFIAEGDIGVLIRAECLKRLTGVHYGLDRRIQGVSGPPRILFDE